MAPSLPQPVRLNWRALLLQRRERYEVTVLENSRRQRLPPSSKDGLLSAP